MIKNKKTSRLDFPINKNLLKSNRSQAWGLDLMIAVTIFSFGILFLFIYAINSSNEADENLNSLQYEGNLIASNLLSSGTPSNWHTLDLDSLVMPGILTDNKIDEDKLAKFNEWKGELAIKNKLNTNFDFCFNIKISSSTYAYPNNGICTATMDNPNNKIKITRFVIYENIPRTLELTIWK